MEAVQFALSAHSYPTATFLAEQLYYQSPEEEKLHLLATTYYLSKNSLQCYELLLQNQKSVVSLNYKNRYLLALVAMELGKLPSAEAALTSDRDKKSGPLESIERTFNELTPFALLLYGKICAVTERQGAAKEAFSRGVKLNPFLWEGVVEGVKVGGELGEQPLDLLYATGSKETESQPPKNILMNRNNRNRTHRNLFTSTPNNNYLSPEADAIISPIMESEPKPKKPCLRTVSSPAQTAQTTVRRSTRLFGNSSTQGTSPGALKENSTPPPKESITTKKTLQNFLQTIIPTATALQQLSKYDSQKSIETLQNVRSQTPTTLKILAKSHFELAQYNKSINYYNQLLQISPYNTDLQYLSSCYWHLSMETELSTLSQNFLSEQENRRNPTTWIILGNTFSLQKEHETAIKFFKRGIMIDSNNAYAYVLLGHEYVATDELDKALRCFRTASRIDGSIYNCWYGIGMIYYKQERFGEAEVYYRKAREINSGNSVLGCHLGVVLSALNQPEKSLKTFESALKSNPRDPLCKFHRASVLFGIGRLEEALEELEELKKIVPKESLVHFLIAKIHSKRGATHKALLHFSWATDLDPKGANNHIKETIEPVLNIE